MSRFSEKLQKAKDFLGRDVWEFEPAELSRARAFLLRQTQVALLVVRDFQADRCLLRASALTYVTLLSIVPVFALMFSLLKGLGVQNTLEPIILKEIAIGSEQIVTEIIRYINNTHVGRLGTVGLITLVLTVLALLSNIEETFNTIWGVQETRSLYRRFSDYFSVLIFGPIFVLVAISMTTTLESQAFVQTLMEMAYVGEVIYFLFKVLPFIAMWAAFTFLYIFMPNIKVDFRAALIGGIFGGTLWQLAQWSYLFFQVGVARYNAIYGTMAALPIFMVWIYVSWIIVLLGMEVSYAYQHLRHIRLEIRGETVNFASREMIALTILLQVAEAFNRGETMAPEEYLRGAGIASAAGQKRDRGTGTTEVSLRSAGRRGCLRLPTRPCPEKYEGALRGQSPQGRRGQRLADVQNAGVENHHRPRTADRAGGPRQPGRTDPGRPGGENGRAEEGRGGGEKKRRESVGPELEPAVFEDGIGIPLDPVAEGHHCSAFRLGQRGFMEMARHHSAVPLGEEFPGVRHKHVHRRPAFGTASAAPASGPAGDGPGPVGRNQVFQPPQSAAAQEAAQDFVSPVAGIDKVAVADEDLSAVQIDGAAVRKNAAAEDVFKIGTHVEIVISLHIDDLGSAFP
jgi:membrane protein